MFSKYYIYVQWVQFTRDLFTFFFNNCTSNNSFMFNERIYVQNDGASIGGVTSPTYAFVTMKVSGYVTPPADTEQLMTRAQPTRYK